MDAYVPVDCDFHDQLEALATLRKECQIVYQKVPSELVKVQGLIVDIYAANKADFLKVDDGTEIRLDRIVSLNNKQASSWSN
ncbi:hypothetical protein IQ230_00455 [Gloeocapsopsis crepidinum LEGE 06123]|uniref:Rho-binding antiterminator n=1 Tax=Gloeocapsopsis crepidinum LEGE 06123 TaxID=588587 RepID=A0ABR9UNA0_9CHRO|nr:hypothetical protein [Gloeocapsopsis crepidinum]MBE9188858.1 hypothetical protein [Gloeocapsopsis crepidinum LEGE 06123]